MSSILDALEKLEARRTPGGGPEPPRRTRRTRTPLLAAAAVVAFAAGIGTTIVWMRPAAEVAAPAPPAVAAPTATTPPSTAPAPTPAPPRATEQPWAEVLTPQAPRGFEAKPIPEGAVAARPPARERGTRRAAVAAVPAPVQAPAAAAAAVPAPAPDPAAPAAAPAPTRPTGAPAVRVSFLVYSNAPERRSVALNIDEAGLVTLHEGEEAAGLSVAQILPNGVELTWQGQSFTVRARD